MRKTETGPKKKIAKRKGEGFAKRIAKKSENEKNKDAP